MKQGRMIFALLADSDQARSGPGYGFIIILPRRGVQAGYGAPAGRGGGVVELDVGPVTTRGRRKRRLSRGVTQSTGPSRGRPMRTCRWMVTAGLAAALVPVTFASAAAPAHGTSAARPMVPASAG